MSAEDPPVGRAGISDGQGVQVGNSNVQNNYYFISSVPSTPHATKVVAGTAGPREQLVLADFGYQDGWQVDRHPRFLADLTGNGRADIIGFGDRGVWTARGNGDGTFAVPRLVLADFGYQDGWQVDRYPRFLADLTGNGRADIIGFGDAGVLTALGNGDGTFAVPRLVLADFGHQDGWQVDRHPRFLADLTGNGRADIIGFGNAGVWTAISNGDGTFAYQPQPVLRDFGYQGGGWQVDRHPRLLADLTGNGRADIIGFGEAGVWTALGNGDGTFAASRLVLAEFGYQDGWQVDRHPRLLADLTGNGHADIIGFGDRGVWTALGKGDGTFAVPRLVLADFSYCGGGWQVDRYPRLLADLTGNGRADIIGFGEAGVLTALGNGDGTFAASRLVLAEFGYQDGWQVDRHPRLLADLTGNGRADIIGFGDPGVYVATKHW